MFKPSRFRSLNSIIFGITFVIIMILKGCNCQNCQDVEQYLCSCSIERVRASKLLYAYYIGLPGLTQDDVTSCYGDTAMLDCPSATAINAYYSSLLEQGRKKRQAYNFGSSSGNPAKQWAMPILYSINLGGFANSTAASATILSAISHVQAQTCVTFRPIGPNPSNTTIQLQFTIGTGCVSFIGRNTDSPITQISLTDTCASSFGSVVFLIAQTLGLFKEELRWDRNSSIYINIANVPSVDIPNFMIVPYPVLLTNGLPYDYASIMQSPPTVFSSTGGLTILTLDPLFQNTIGQRVALSFIDSLLINTQYCSGTCSSSPALVCLQGGYQDPLVCSQCRCPDGFSGPTCGSLTPHDSSICQQQLLTASLTPAYLYSPGYSIPGYYNSFTSCTWQITSPPGTLIALTFIGNFGIYCVSDACYHWVEIRYQNALNETGPRFCCNSLPQVSIVSTSNEVLILFRSNFSDAGDATTNRGFTLAYNYLPCSPTWKQRNNANSNHGVQVMGRLFNTAECLDYCLLYTGCVGVDVDNATAAYPYVNCWLHLNVSDFDVLLMSQTVTQYQLMGSTCVTVPTTTTSTTTTTTVATTTTTPPTTIPGCLATFSSAPGVQSVGATQYPNIQSDTACLAECSSLPACVAVDVNYNTNPPQCWIYQNPSLLYPKYRAPGITQYVETQQCVNGMLVSVTAKTTTTSTTTPTTTTTTPTTTTSTSTTTTTTTTTTSTSTTTTTTTMQTTTTTQPSTTTTTTTPATTTTTTATAPPTAASGACQPTWRILKALHSVGASRNTKIMTQIDCLNYCLSDDDCVAVDIETSCSPVQCWIHTNPADLLEEYQDDPNVIQYQVLTRCPESQPPCPPCNCNGFNLLPGQMMPPCTTNVYPLSICTTTTWTLTLIRGSYIPSETISYVPCVTNTCCGNAQQITYLSQTQCVVTGWSGWTACTASCGAFGVQYSYFYDVVDGFYVTCNQRQQVCNTQPCECDEYFSGCTRCCSGFQEFQGSCIAQG